MAKIINTDEIKARITDAMMEKYREIIAGLTPERIAEVLKAYMIKAKEFLTDDERVEHFLQEAEELLYIVPVVGDLLTDIPTIISMIRAYVKKEYNEVASGSIIAILAGLIYFVAPVDLVPDFIPGLGKVDDIAILAYIIKKVDPDVQKYKEWQKKNNKR